MTPVAVVKLVTSSVWNSLNWFGKDKNMEVGWGGGGALKVDRLGFQLQRPLSKWWHLRMNVAFWLTCLWDIIRLLGCCSASLLGFRCVWPRGQILSWGGMRRVGGCPPRWPSESGFLHNIGTAGNAGKRTRLALQSQKLTRMQTHTPDLIFNLGGSLFCRFSRFSSTVVQLLILWRQDQNGEGRITSLRIVSRTLYKQAAASHKTGTVKIF